MMTVDIIANLSPSVAGHIDHDAPTPRQNGVGRQKCFWRPTPFTPTENTTEKEQKNGHERRGPKDGGGRNPRKSTQNHLTITIQTGNVIGGWEEPLPTNEEPPGVQPGGSTTKQEGGDRDDDRRTDRPSKRGSRSPGIHRSSHRAVADVQARARPTPQVKANRWPRGKPRGHPHHPRPPKSEPGVGGGGGGGPPPPPPRAPPPNTPPPPPRCGPGAGDAPGSSGVVAGTGFEPATSGL